MYELFFLAQVFSQQPFSTGRGHGYRGRSRNHGPQKVTRLGLEATGPVVSCRKFQLESSEWATKEAPEQ